MTRKTNRVLWSAVLSAVGFRVPALADTVDFHLERITPVLNQPTYLSQAPGDPANTLYYSTRITSSNSGFSATNSMGTIYQYIINGNTTTTTPVLDLSSRIITNDDGLQTFAFNPDFNNATASGYGKIYVASAERSATSLNRVEEFTILNGNGTLKTPAQAFATDRLILQYSNSAQNNHTVDWVGFDPNATGAARNYLYITTGDGSFGNSYNNASGTNGRPSQNPSDVKGKILRVDISGGDDYDGTHTINGVLLPNDANKNFAIPTDNPLVVYNTAHPSSQITGPAGAAVANEVYVTGVRNGYRISFDLNNSDIYIGDVGENTTEEVNFLKAGSNASGPPADFGWPQREGMLYSNVSGAPNTSLNPFTGITTTNPIQNFLHQSVGTVLNNIGFCSIGGYVYRGPVASLQGKYFYADFVTGRIWEMSFDRNTDPTTFNGRNATATQVDPLWNALITDALAADPSSYVSNARPNSLNGIDHVVSFAQDNSGNMYIIDFGNGTTFDGEYTASAGEIFKIVPGSLSVPATAAWTGANGPSWETLSGNNTNFNTDRTSGNNTLKLPGYASDVVFGTTTPAAANFSTVLDRDFFVNSLTIKSGTPAVSINNGTSGTRDLVILGSTGITLESGSSGLTIGATVEVGANQSWSNNSTASLMINGAVFGPGGISLTGTLTLGTGTLSITGPMTFAPASNSRLLLNGPSTASNLSSVGTLIGDGTAIIENATSTAATASNTIETYSSDVGTFGGIIRDGTVGRVGVRLNGGGVFAPTGTLVNTGPLSARYGKIILSGAQNVVGGGSSVTVGDTANLPGVLEIDGSSVSGGGTATAPVQIGASTSLGALILNSGSLTSSNELWIAVANGGYGALLVNGGTVTTNSWLAVARGGGSGIFNVTGGTVNVNGNPLTIGSISGGASTLHAVATFSGGTITVARNMFVSEQNSAVVTISGSASVIDNGTASIGGSVGVAFGRGDTATATTGILNLIGGTLTATTLMKPSNTNSATTGIVNFNGGTLKANAATMFAANFINGLTNAYVWPGGGVIDDGGQTITISQQLQAPTGSGVSSVSVAPGVGYFAPPLVTLSSGGGVGASAIANLDANGNLTGITVTNPGVGYTTAPTVTLSGGGGYQTGTASNVTIASNASGGLTKLGAGSLVLAASNSYTGPTTIAGGTLVIASNDNLGDPAAGGAIVFTGGTLQTSNSFALDNAGNNRRNVLLSGNGTVSLVLGNTLTVSGIISGAGNLTVNGAGSTLLVTGAANYSGLTTVGSGATLDFGGGVTHTTGMLNGGNGTITVDVGTTLNSGLPTSSTVGKLNVNGVHKIAVNASLTNRTGRVSILNIGGSGPSSWTGKLDLTNNNLIVGSATNTTSFTNVQNQITQAAGAPVPANPWNGAGGITSSSAAAASTGATKTGLGYASGTEYTTLTGLTLFDSLTFNSTDTLIKYTLVGDANLDGTVDINDFFALSGHINLPGDWSQGNFNYSGNVTIDDFFAMTGNFGKSLAVGSLVPNAAAVPEPATLLLLAAPLLWLRRRRPRFVAAAGP